MKRTHAQTTDEDAEPPFSRAEAERSLAEKIRAWAALHKRCPLGGCRRNRRCLHDDCRAVSREPISDEERLRIGRHFKAALARFADKNGGAE